MSDHVFGFCQSAPGTKQDAYHAVCPGEYTTQFGVTHRCTCPGHSTDDSDKLGATKESGPAQGATRRGRGRTTEEFDMDSVSRRRPRGSSPHEVTA